MFRLCSRWPPKRGRWASTSPTGVFRPSASTNPTSAVKCQTSHSGAAAAAAGGQQGDRGDEREDPHVARHLGQVVVREEGGLAERAEPPSRSGTSISSSHRCGSEPELNRATELAPRWDVLIAARPGSHCTAPRQTPSSQAAGDDTAAGPRAGRGGRPARPRRYDDHAGSSMARGSPARIVRPNAWPGPRSRPSRRGWPGPREPEDAQQLQRHPAHPATSPSGHLRRHGPGEGERERPSRLARLPRRRARRKQNIPSPATAQVTIMLSVQAAAGQDGEQERERVRGPGVPVSEQRRAAPDVRVIQR